MLDNDDTMYINGVRYTGSSHDCDENIGARRGRRLDVNESIGTKSVYHTDMQYEWERFNKKILDAQFLIIEAMMTGYYARETIIAQRLRDASTLLEKVLIEHQTGERD
jgi:hypothetical protein